VDVQQASVDARDELDADAVRRWGRAAAAALQAHRAEIDGLNVFPVADRDTGSNLALTMAAAADELDAAVTATAADALAVLARAAVVGARGNSGVIMSQLLRGMASVPANAAGYRAEEIRAGLAAGVECAYAAVAEPVEGTILTVAKAAADALPPGPVGLLVLVRAAAAAAAAALERTPQQLAPLARAGVVDAGGRGLVLVLDALVRVVAGEDDPPGARLSLPEGAPHIRGVRESGSSEFEYEVQYLLDAPAAATAGLRRALLELGDSIVIAGTGDGTWNVHAHVNDVGAAIEAGVAAGTARQISVTRFDDAAPGASPTAVVAVAQGPALRNLFTREGITVVEPAGGTALAAEDVLSAIRASGAAQVVLLPNAPQVTRVAEAAAATARAAGARVAVVPTRSPVQGLAAVAVHDRRRDFDDDVVAMAEAAAATRFAEIVIATEQSLTSVGICEAGDVLGMIDGEVVEIGRGVVPVAFSLVARLLAVGAEVMTVLVGGDAPAGLGELVAGHVRERAPLTDVTVYLGGSTGCPLTIGVE
jgi:DAK2 domain fusion protein YloV